MRLPTARTSAEPSTMLPAQSWAQHMTAMRTRWKQGEHILLAAPTNAGKSTLMAQLVRIRRHVVVFVSKVHDDTFTSEFKGWRVVRDWDDVRQSDEKVLLWPKAGKTLRETVWLHRQAFAKALNKIGNGRGWCVVIDEMHYMADRAFCGLDAEIKILHHQGRSQKISMVSLTQRPAWIPNIIYSSVTHAYVARTRDKRDLARLSDFGGVDGAAFGRGVVALPTRHDYAYINPQGDAPPVMVNVRR